METLCPDPTSTTMSSSPKVESQTPSRTLESDPIHEEEEAVEYDEMVRRYQWLLNKPFVDLLTRQSLKQGRILDIGTGPGWIPIEVARRKPQWEYWAVDPSNDMLERAREHARKAGVSDRVHFVQGDALNLPFPDGHFDLVTSHFMLHHIEHPEKMFNEAARVTRGGGRVLIKDLRRQSRWKASILLAFSKLVLRYSESQMKMYRESLGAALTEQEIRQALGHSRLSMARVTGFRGLDLVITG